MDEDSLLEVLIEELPRRVAGVGTHEVVDVATRHPGVLEAAEEDGPKMWLLRPMITVPGDGIQVNNRNYIQSLLTANGSGWSKFERILTKNYKVSAMFLVISG